MQTILKVVLVLILLAMANWIFAQQLSQTVRGTILDKDSKTPLFGASVLVVGSDPIQGAVTDENGQFLMEEVVVGRINLQITYVGYTPQFLNELMVTSGKELVLNLELEESTEMIEDVVITATDSKSDPLNEMAMISARSFSVEETSRYASSFYDPARMAQNYAGVNLGGGNSDLYNEIIVRGNSPRGVLWRLEGVEIPNPNHFGALGNSGGAISMLSSSTLTKSDFYTGAFPAEFGNATSGVFDLRMRNGNNQKREYAFMVGLLGIEAAAEGYFSKNSNASYLINYRYSTLAALKAIGLNPVGDVLPAYQDLSFKINLPTEGAGTFALFGLGGMNNARYEPERDSSLWEDGDEWGYEERQKVGTVGFSHRLSTSNNGYWKTVGVISRDEYVYDDYELLPSDNYKESVDETSRFVNDAYRFSTSYTHKFNARHTVRTGAIFSHLKFDLNVRFKDDDDIFQNYLDNRGETQLWQGFSQWKFRINDDLTLNSGFHASYFTLNEDFVIEPRLGLKWQFKTNQSLNGAVGLHSKPEHVSFYFVETTDDEGIRTAPNKNVGLQKAMHAVLGYDIGLGANWNIHAEAYYQHLYDVPVEKDPESNESIINASDIWDLIGSDPADNSGVGRNIGLDLTVEKFFSNQYYFLLTGSIFDSKYTIHDRTFNTKFNSNYQLNVLGGKEFSIGKKQKNILGVNGKVILAGGNRYTPIDLEQSRIDEETVLFEDRAYEAQTRPYYRIDLGVSYKINTERMTHTLMLDIQNVTNHLNVFTQYYDEDTDQLEEWNQTGLFPVLNYRIEF